MLFRSPARKRQVIIRAALERTEETRKLSDIQLRLAWSKVHLRVKGAGKPSRQRDQLKKELPEALALAREAGRRALGLEAFPVQMEGAVVLMDGQIAEMRTGEGKTLVAAMGAALATLVFDHVHLVTVNEYLAQRDCELMAPLFTALGLQAGVVVSAQSPDEKKAAYAQAVTYGVNSEFGFDFLRNYMVSSSAERTQGALATSLAIVDEADAILIDDARTPLIITQSAEASVAHLPAMTALANALEEEADFTVDKKEHRVQLTEGGYARVENWLHQQGWLENHAHLYDSKGVEYLYRLDAALKARTLYQRNVHYLVGADQSVSIIDESTGRVLHGRRWSEGIHQAVESKEGVPILPETEVHATITYQHFFRLYGGLAGLTGTAATEKAELEEMYGLAVTTIPTHRPVIRVDGADRVYKTKQEKYGAIIAEVQQRHAKGQPILLGTPSVAVSEELSALLSQHGLPHQLLNAKQNRQEADVIAQAGMPGVITVATNMAGRGTDIILGGSVEKRLAALRDAGDAETANALHAEWQARREAVRQAGGLYVIGAERHESRRIDNQLRGRAGRQGDPGESCFFLSLEDDLLRVFGTGIGRFAVAQMEEGEALISPLLTRAIAKAQQARENRGFEQRKQLARYDGVLADQRHAVYSLRDQLLEDDTRDQLRQWGRSQLEQALRTAAPQDLPFEMVTAQAVNAALAQHLSWQPAEDRVAAAMKDLDDIEAFAPVIAEAWESYLEATLNRAEAATDGRLHLVALSALDKLWRAQLTQLDTLREGIHLRAYAQKDTQREYYEEAGRLFEAMADALRREALALLAQAAYTSLAVEPVSTPPTDGPAPALDRVVFLYQHRRNRPCECGSGERFKRCCGALRTEPAPDWLDLPVGTLRVSLRAQQA